MIGIGFEIRVSPYVPADRVIVFCANGRFVVVSGARVSQLQAASASSEFIRSASRAEAGYDAKP